MFDLLIEGGTIVSMDNQGTIIPQGYIAVSDGKIAETGECQALKNRSAKSYVDARGKAVLPGLIDCHCHAGHSFTRGSAIEDWETVAEDIYYRCSTPDFWYAEARIAAAEKLRFGTTTSVNMLGNTPRIDSQDIIDAHFEGALSAGGRVMSGIGSPNPPWPKLARKWNGASFTEKEIHPKDAYAPTEQVIRKWHNTHGGRAYSLAAPSRIGCAAPNSHELAIEQMQAMRDIADRYGVRLHGHAYAGDILFTAQKFPKGLGEDVFIAHCTGISEEEMHILANTGTTVVTGPSTVSHIYNRCPVPELLNAGGRVVIGTDGNAPDRTFDLWKDLRIGQLLHRNFHHDPSLLPAKKVLEMVTRDAARALGLERLIGSIETGKRADLILVDTEQPHLYPFFNPVEQLVNAASGQDVTDVIVDGEMVMQDRKLLKADIRQLLIEAKREFEAALRRGRYLELFGLTTAK